jgi:hypothetical protein
MGLKVGSFYMRDVHEGWRPKDKMDALAAVPQRGVPRRICGLAYPVPGKEGATTNATAPKRPFRQVTTDDIVNHESGWKSAVRRSRWFRDLEEVCLSRHWRSGVG